MALWRQLSASEFAHYERSQGNPVAIVHGMPWRRVRPFFYRPLLAHLPLDPRSVRIPPAARLGAVQFGVRDPGDANGAFGMLVFTDGPAYTLATLNSKRRWQVKTAEKHFLIRPILDATTFAREAHPVYLAFQARTLYSHKAERRHAGEFERWARTLYARPETGILGGYLGSRLGGISISQWVGDTLMYLTMFADDQALHLNFPSLMLHRVRELAAATPGIARIVAGMQKTGAGRTIDAFYLERGCTLLRIPAVLRANPLAQGLLKLVRPAAMQALRGADA